MKQTDLSFTGVQCQTTGQIPEVTLTLAHGLSLLV